MYEAALSFPIWLRAAHWISAFFNGLIIRNGIQILGALPKLNWGDDATPGTEWLKFTKNEPPLALLRHTLLGPERPGLRGTALSDRAMAAPYPHKFPIGHPIWVKPPDVEGEKGVAQPVSLFLRNGGYIPADTVADSHRPVLPSAPPRRLLE